MKAKSETIPVIIIGPDHNTLAAVRDLGRPGVNRTILIRINESNLNNVCASYSMIPVFNP